MEVNVDDLLRD